MRPSLLRVRNNILFVLISQPNQMLWIVKNYVTEMFNLIIKKTIIIIMHKKFANLDLSLFYLILYTPAGLILA